jgi:hypothetical protein
MYFLCSCGCQFLEFPEVMLQRKVKLLYIMMIKVCSSSNPCNYIDVGLSQVRAPFQTPANAIKSLSLCILGRLLFSVDDIAIVIFFSYFSLGPSKIRCRTCLTISLPVSAFGCAFRSRFQMFFIMPNLSWELLNGLGKSSIDIDVD